MCAGMSNLAAIYTQVGRHEEALALHEETLARDQHLDLGRAPYVLYCVKYIDLVSLCALPRYSPSGMYHCHHVRPLTLTWVVRPMFRMVLNILA